MDPRSGHPEENQAALTLEVDGDGVAWFTFDRPGARHNLLSREVMEELDRLLAETEVRVQRGDVRGVVLRSGKDGTFIAGADIEQIAAISDGEEGRRGAAEGQRLFSRLESLPVPTVAAIDGICLGGGTELILACSYRIASDRPETRIGLPEVRLGIMPGWGGSVRLPRLVGLRAALELILTGKTIPARRAARIGLVDERVPAPILSARAGEIAREEPEAVRDRAGRDRGFLARLLEDTAPGRRIVLAGARRKVLAETRGHYPAPLEALDTMRATLSLPLDQAFHREAEAVGRLIVTPESRNLIHVFQLMEAAKKAAPPVETPEVRRISVIGAGVMGGGIAQLAASHGISVRMKDIREDALSQGLRTARDLFERSVQRHRMDRREADEALRRISPTLDYTGFGTADLIIEAVVERLDVKKQVLSEAERHAGPDAVLASNTSTLSISSMQEALDRPERFCGMHFFNPVHRMPLVEVIRGARTSDAAVATVFRAARRMDKTPLVVRDGPGFLVNRLLAPYLNEAGWLLAEGASIESVDRVLLDFGMPMGPFRLLDEVGLDVARHAATVLNEAFGERMRPAHPLQALQAGERLGRKGGLGFYRYEDGKEREPDASIYGELAGFVPGRRVPVDDAEVRDRCVLVMVNEAARVLEEGIVEGAGDVDLGMITGTGFPPFRGGLLRYADDRGLGAIVQRLEELEGAHGDRFAPAPLLLELAAGGRTFYDPHVS